MIKFFILNKIIFLLFFISTSAYAENLNSFDEGQKLFEIKKYEEAKIYFERDIVFNPKEHKSYLYLAKIFKKNENDQELEKNLNSVLLLSPNNDEAIYMMVLLKIKQYDYAQAKQFIKKFDLVCKSFCSKKAQIEEKFSKLVPDNAKDNN